MVIFPITGAGFSIISRISVGLLGAFGIIRTMTNLKCIIDEMDDKTAKTAYGKEIQSIPIGVLKFVFAGFFVIIAIVQLTAIY